MEVIAEIILKSGRSAVELALFVVLPVMVLMLSLMRLLESRGVLQAVARLGGPLLAPVGVPGLGVFAMLQLLFVSFAAPIATLATMDRQGTSERHIAATFAMVFAMAQANVTFPMAATGLNVLALMLVSLAGGVVAAGVTFHWFGRRLSDQEVAGSTEVEDTGEKLRRMGVYRILQAAGKEALEISLAAIPMLVLSLFVVNALRAAGAIGQLESWMAPALAALDLPPGTLLAVITKYIAGGTAMMGVFVEFIDSGVATAGDLNRLAGLLINPLDLAGVAVLISAGARVAAVARPAIIGGLVGIAVRSLLHWMLF